MEEIDGLIRALSLSEDRLPTPREIRLATEEASKKLPLPDRFAGEPYRRYLMIPRYKLRSLLGEQPGPGYASGGELVAELRAIEAGLAQLGLKKVAQTLVKPARVRAEAYGLDLVSLDLREESRQHAEAVAELLRVGGEARTTSSLAQKSAKRCSPRNCTPPARWLRSATAPRPVPLAWLWARCTTGRPEGLMW